MDRTEMVKAYLQVLDLNDREFNFQFLGDLVARHVATLAFSSVGYRLGDDLPLDFESLFQRIVTKRRGGYCFEQNGLLFGVLEELGFAPQLYLARVIFNEDTHPGLTHRISLVKFDGEHFVLDVGFGSLGPRIPVRMSGAECRDGSQVVRIEERGNGEFHLQVLKEGEFFSLYRFELARYGQSDCELGHFYSHRHPKANFVNHLVVSLILEHEVRSLQDMEYRVITDSTTEIQAIESSDQLWRILVEELGIQITERESRRLAF